MKHRIWLLLFPPTIVSIFLICLWLGMSPTVPAQAAAAQAAPAVDRQTTVVTPSQ